jgi:hypothetical protein
MNSGGFFLKKKPHLTPLARAYLLQFRFGNILNKARVTAIDIEAHSSNRFAHFFHPDGTGWLAVEQDS